jgi:hypothetical protein
MSKTYTLHIHTIEFVDHGNKDKWDNEITWAEDEAHAVEMFYKRHKNCSIVSVEKLADKVEQNV